VLEVVVDLPRFIRLAACALTLVKADRSPSGTVNARYLVQISISLFRFVFHFQSPQLREPSVAF
jgi:hypothetical protein